MTKSLMDVVSELTRQLNVALVEEEVVVTVVANAEEAMAVVKTEEAAVADMEAATVGAAKVHAVVDTEVATVMVEVQVDVDTSVVNVTTVNLVTAETEMTK